MALTTDMLIQEVETMTVLELANLVKALENHFGVSAAAVAAPSAAGPAAVVEEQTEFTVFLKAAGANKLAVIKAVRVLLPSLGLKEAKDLVDGAPKEVKENVTKDEAAAAMKMLVEAGAEVEIK